MKIKVGDIFVILLIIFFAITVFFLVPSKGKTVIVEVDGSIIAEFDLSDTTEYVYKDKYTNVITIKNNCVYISSSDCPDNTCVHSGKISSSNKVICCLPNKLIIRIGEQDSNETDVISG